MNTTVLAGELASATGEILIILLGAFILGWLARYVYELIVHGPEWGEDYMDEYFREVDDMLIEYQKDEQAQEVEEEIDEEEEDKEEKKKEKKEKRKEKAQVVFEEQTVSNRYMDATQSPVEMMPYKKDDLQMVEGIGPKISQLLIDGGIDTWQKLADTDAEDIKTLLRNAGDRYRIHDPTTWPEQAELAVEGKWAELEEYQSALSGGKDLTRIYKKTS
ncbi:MAG: helix-hairpin-helix domain-containing protein [Patescibacteria group bacterium]